jgi:uncharacterized protein (DUF983 family)
MYKEDTLTETAPTQRKNNLRGRTKHTDKKEKVKNPEIKMGYGACSVSGCYCKGYMGSADTCQNCGHNYGLHW